MTRKKIQTRDTSDLRRQAEARLEGREAEKAFPSGDEDSRRLVHELRVHQIELEMQNEELQGARAEAEAGLERYTDLYDFAPVGYVTLDSNGTIREANLTAARMLGGDRSQLVGGRLGHFVFAGHRFSLDAFLKRVFARQTKEVCELALGTDQSTSSWVQIEAAVSGNSARECRAALVDVTERRRLDEAVRFRMELIDFAVEHSLQEVLQKAMDAIGALTDSPIGFCHFVEADQQTLSLQAWFTRTGSAFFAAEGHGRRYPMDEATAWADCVRQRRPVIRNDGPSSPHREGLLEGPAAVGRELVVPIIRSDQVVAIVAVGNRPTDYTDQDVVVVSHLADVTWVVVERMIAERAREESERLYREAAEALREVDRNRTQFLAMLSHELRNPLAPIKSSLYILDRAVPGGDQAKRAQVVIDRQVGQLSRLVNDLLDATRISSGKVQLKLERTDLNEVVRRTVEDHRSVFEKNGVQLEVTSAEVPAIVMADWARIAQVIGNLLNNAAKFTGRGGSTRVSVARDEGARQAVVCVADTGVGISPEILGRLFERFTQADRTLDRSAGGLGLGLALVKGFVELHGGEVSANSAGPGQGSEFIVRLPLDAVQVVAKSEVPVAERHARRVLVIEDNVDAADSLGEALELNDHEVEVAYTGPEGLLKARQFKPDVVLCDIGLPGMDGYEVARAFRSDEVLKGIFLVALSGYALPEDLERSASAGFHRHIAKPPSLEGLEALLEKVPHHSAGTLAASERSPSDLMH
jgi:two-component system CheB/CheR fusion protein